MDQDEVPHQEESSQADQKVEKVPAQENENYLVFPRWDLNFNGKHFVKRMCISNNMVYHTNYSNPKPLTFPKT